MLCDPVKSRKNAFNDGTLKFYLNKTFAAGDPIGNYANGDLEYVLKGWLVGVTMELSPIIPRSLEWLDSAIADDEQLGEAQNFHRMQLHWAKAIGLWMQNSINDAQAWDRVRFYCEAAFTVDKNVWPKNHIATLRLDDYLAFCFQAQQYKLGIAEFQKYHGIKTISLKRVLKPREYAYALCLHKVSPQFEADALLAAGKKMLAANLEEDWLGRGQNIRAATWLKIVHWQADQQLSPIQTMLKAYDDMPQVPKPSFV